MPSLYSDIDKSNWVYQPNYVRSRARYRGPRESYYLNRMISQTVYDIRKLYEGFDTADDLINIDLEALELGRISNNIYYRWAGGTTQPFDFNGTNDLSLRISSLRQRVKALEEG